MNLEILSHIWTVFVKSNAFNFVVFVLIFAWIIKKFNFKGMFEALQKKIADIIEEAKRTKAEAQQELITAEKEVENLPQVLNEIIQDAEKSANVIGEKILNEAKKQIESIESNAVKVIEAEEKLLISKLTKNTSKVSVEIAKSHVESVLEQTPSLHEKYINESIEELDRLSF